ncbi:MAG: hypothetical protein Athens101410_678 [Parcubacteria group bacterium Athens1014_10]|nr:MAG: hypothetical protein Athens101410_678 [Parcubacteria group bacterium Athens1014_10]TSD05187.1 MAG: hypothetical protein Athens071412_385 [Parcubacteria group bacterium Athens0714_12]
MPRYNGTGPLGYDQGTGWGMGPCGSGMARGRGFGWRNFYTKKEESEILNEEVETLEKELKAIKERLSELKGQK